MSDKMIDEEWTEEAERRDPEIRIDDSGKVEKRKRNRRKKRKRRNRNWLLIPAFLVVLAIIVLVFFRAQNLQIEGNRRVSEDEVKEVIRWDSCQGNTLLLWLLNRKVDVSSNELLAKINVSIVNPQTVRVEVEEQSLVAGVLIGEQYFYVNDSGLVILSQKDMIEAIPLIEGIDVEKAEVSSYLKTGRDDVLDDMLDIAECLADYEISAESIEETGEGGYMIRIGKITVLLGPDIYMEEKVSELKDLLPELDDLSGTLHLENYDSTKDSIIFTKDS